MVMTRGMSNNAVNVIEEMFTNSDNLDSDTETIVTNICVNLKKLVANYPHINVSEFELDIFNLLKCYDTALTTIKKSEEVINNLKREFVILESRLEREKDLRQSELNESYNELDTMREVRDDVLKENSVVHSSLIKVKANLEIVSDECLSLQSVITDKDLIIAKLSSDLETSFKQNVELTERIKNLKSSITTLEEKSWLSCRWVDDSILESYFKSFNDNTCTDLYKVIFMGPSVSQIVKHGSDVDVKALLDNLEFFESDYAFLCISDSVDTVKADTGSHWSLLFVDVCSQSVYHLDSLHGSNKSAAKLITCKLGFTVGSLLELSCTQQNNAYECGLSVLVNAKFIKEGFCTQKISGLTFCDWYSLFREGPHSLLSSNKCFLALTEPTVGEAAVTTGDSYMTPKNCDPSFDEMRPRSASVEWKTVKSNKKPTLKALKTSNSLLTNNVIKCTNSFEVLSEEKNTVNDRAVYNEVI